jgi:hypothetical protein
MNMSIFSPEVANSIGKNQIILGPHRVMPGRLSVSRSFGDVEAKHIKFGGNPNVVTAVPDIISFKIDSTMDFIALGCDGIFDQMSDKDVGECFWLTVRDGLKANSLHLQCSLAIDMIIKTSLVRKTLDNVTCVIIAFENLERLFNKSFEIEVLEKANNDTGKPHTQPIRHPYINKPNGSGSSTIPPPIYDKLKKYLDIFTHRNERVSPTKTKIPNKPSEYFSKINAYNAKGNSEEVEHNGNNTNNGNIIKPNSKFVNNVGKR